MMRLLFVPGWHGSGPAHWQSLWREEMGGERVEQDDWEHPDPAAWVARLDAHVGEQGSETLLVAHSLGVLTVALWALSSPKKCAGAFLVALPDPETSCRVIGRFREARSTQFAFPTLTVGSENDPYASWEAVSGMASGWGSEVWHAGAVGHINVASGHGPWESGRAQLEAMMQALRGGKSLAA